MKAKKHLGQNFLINNDTLDTIIQSADIEPQDTVIEVGPGKGILTAALLKKAAKVISIEKDEDLISHLQQTFKNNDNFELINADVLETIVPTEAYKVVANIPYYITSPILRHFLQSKNPPQSLTLLVQLEVAEKICAKQGDHSILSLQVQLYGTPTIIAKVPPSHFAPSPKVNSAILHITTFEKTPYADPLKILKLAKLGFSQKRKKLRNTLAKSLQLDVEKIEQKTGISFNLRPETLSLDDWNRLSAVIG